MRKNLIIFVLSVMTVLLTTSCGAAENLSNETITLTDLAGRTVSIDLPVNRVVLTFYFEEYVPVEGGENPFKRIVGWSRGYWEGRRQGTWETYTSAIPEINEIPDVGYISKGSFSVEKVISLNPDVVIMWMGDYEANKEDVAKLEKAKIQVVFLDYHAETLEVHNQSTMILGKILGREERAEEIIDFYRDQEEIITTKIKEIEGPKPTVYVEAGNLFVCRDY